MSSFARYFFPIAFFITLGALLWLWLAPRNGDSPVQTTLNRQRETALVKAVERVAPSVVSIAAVKKTQVQYSRVEELLRRRMLGPLSQDQLQATEIGSGIVLDEDGYVLTNDHLVGRSEQVWVTTSQGEEFEARVVGTDARYDLAVIQVENAPKDTFIPAPLGDSNALLVGEWVVALGNPYGQLLVNPEPSVTAGVISALNRDIEDDRSTAIYKNMIQTDATINPGNSGGPLVNADGEVVGINTFAFQQSGVSLGLGFAIPINTALELSQDLIRFGKVRGAWVGIAVFAMSELPSHSLRALGLEGTDMNGVVVWTLERGSPAARAGVELGDVIRAVNGEAVSTSSDAVRAIFGARVGDTITFSIERRGDQLEIPVTLEAPPTERLQEVSP